MTKTRTPKKPKVVWVGSTPITPISEKQSRKLDERIRRRKEWLRTRYPEIHGRIVDYVSHSIEDGTLFVNVVFKDKTNFSLRFACEIHARSLGTKVPQDAASGGATIACVF
jgi:hypothetical protein